MANNYLFLEQIVSAIHKGEFNEMIDQWSYGTDRAIINYMYKEKADIKKAADYYGCEEDFIKNRIRYIVSSFDKLNENQNHESFSKRGR